MHDGGGFGGAPMHNPVVHNPVIHNPVVHSGHPTAGSHHHGVRHHSGQQADGELIPPIVGMTHDRVPAHKGTPRTAGQRILMAIVGVIVLIAFASVLSGLI
jgi:hypothetical protein